MGKAVGASQQWNSGAAVPRLVQMIGVHDHGPVAYQNLAGFLARTRGQMPI